MSRIGKRPVAIPSGVEAKIDNGTLTVKGPKGTLSMGLSDLIDYKVDGDEIQVNPANDTQKARAFWGMHRTLVSNLVDGVTEGYTKTLEITGVGYRAQAQGKKLNLSLGFSHPVEYELPEGVTAETPSQTEIVIKGIDKQRVGQVSAEIRAYRPPEPYKGKGVRYADEYVRRKEAKKK